MALKPNQIVPKVPLQPLPALQEPSRRRIIVDCLEPLPKKRSGHQYLMTIMCASSRFPEAVPLRNISAKVIVRALTKLFTPVGLQVLSSLTKVPMLCGIFQHVMHELGVTQYMSTACHPQSQRALERWHQTPKNIMRIYCFETEED